jgi:spermidine/putrescine transport system substrate-binding protein
MRNAWFGGALLALTVLGCDAKKDAPPPPASSGTLHVFVWANYLDPEVVKGFETEFRCRVEESNFDDNEGLRAKLLAGSTGFDLVCPSDYMVPQLVKDGVLEEIDAAHVPNVKNLSPQFAAPAYDPAHSHSMPFQWGVTGIAYRKSVKDPPHAWKDMFDETKLAAWKGRVSMLKDARELAAAALLSLGFSPNTRDPGEIGRAHDLCVRQKAYVAKYDSSNYASSLVAKETLIAQGWSGDVANAQTEDAEIAFVVPDEGTLSYVDNWAIPKGAPAKALAEAFIDYMLRADVAAKSANARRYASVNEAAKPLISPDVLHSAAYEDGHGKRLHRLEDSGPAAEAYARILSDVQTK